MSVIELSVAQIVDNCNRVVDRAGTYERNLVALYDTMNLTGCRCGEVCEIERWNVISSTKIELTTEKGSTIRTFTDSQLNPFFYNIISDPDRPPLVYSRSRLRSFFDTVSFYSEIFVGNKGISSHLFRHAKMKTMFQDGSTFEEIADYFALNEIRTAQKYVESVVYINS